MKQIVFATNNPHKLEEIRQIAGTNLKILSLAEIDCHDDIPETADTLEGNAQIKARYIKEKYGYDCFADDTGLEIVALANQPGVYSTRFGGKDCNPQRNMEKVLNKMKGIENRQASFRTVIALILGNETHLFEGSIPGEITTGKRGDAGFGYDPIFQPTGYSLTFAELGEEEKNKISHRAIATGKLLQFLRNIL